ncbi:MAG TPA: excinuclease ABC subunit UvrA, partial [Sorangium sp.]|nr:excinuclease ABC subunit UvrA [Sorangium sp.]
MHAIVLRGARTHHLKGVDLDIHPGELLVLTGVSGAGKSSLAFDTLYSEGQRRFVESFSPYARQFLERRERPPMDWLEPVAAAVAVDRRAPIKSSRSTVATMADLAPYLSALFLRAALPLCPSCGVLAQRTDPVTAAQQLSLAYGGRRALISYAQRVTGTESYLEARDGLLRAGYRRLLVGADAEVRDVDDIRPSEVVASGSLDVLVDRVRLGKRQQRRTAAALEEAWRRARRHDGGPPQPQATLHILPADGASDNAAPVRLTSAQGLSCSGCGASFEEPSAGLFSYQSPVGACPGCRGFGRVLGIDWDKVVPDPTLSLKRRAIKPWNGKKSARERRLLKLFCEEHSIPYEAPWGELTAAQRKLVIDGAGGRKNRRSYPGLRRWFQWLETKTYKMHVRVMLSRFRSYDLCTACDGKRLSEKSLMYRVDGLDLGQWHRLELRCARARLEGLTRLHGQGRLAVDELVARLQYLERVGLGYLTLHRQARSLSGGEAQRVSLTAALGTSLTGALFVLDEPTVGLHPSDVPPLVEAMRQLCDRGNAVIVIEHDATVITAADRVVELGPGAGPHGGEVVFDGSLDKAKKRPTLATARALAPLTFAAPAKGVNKRPRLTLVGARHNNLRGVNVSLPVASLVVVCGPSGSGKSTLAEQVLYRAMARQLGNYKVPPPGIFQRIDGADAITAAELVDQAPMGRTSRGNAATYSGAWTRVRQLLAAQPAAVLRGFSAAHFSFNVAAGRCQACAGEGAETVEMQFLADVRLSCPVCHGRRFRDEVLEVTMHGRNVAELLALTVEEALELFALDSAIERALSPLSRLGLGYLPLGQPLSTLSGGEAQRLKLAR